MSIFSIALLIFGISQLYWAWRGYGFLTAHISSRPRRWALCAALFAIYFLEYQFNLGVWRERSTPVYFTLGRAARRAVSLVGRQFVLCVPGRAAVRHSKRNRKAVRRLRSPRQDLPSPARRDLLQDAANVAIGAPFVAGAYGLLYGRLNLDIAPRTIHLPRLPRAFEGFRICQLSDIHIGPFMPADEIRKYVAIANAQKADMIVLTGDFVTFDPDTQGAVVDALRGLRAPFGVYGSLGNHDAWAGVEDSITELFRQAGVRILRAANASITASGESFNLIGVDFQSARRFGPSPPVKNLLGDIEAHRRSRSREHPAQPQPRYV